MGLCDHPTQREVPTAGIDPNAAYWPTPMTWGEVRGQVRGNYRIQCYYKDDRLPEIVGRFTLELRGGGVVLGSYTDDRYTREANGISSSWNRPRAFVGPSQRLLPIPRG